MANPLREAGRYQVATIGPAVDLFAGVCVADYAAGDGNEIGYGGGPAPNPAE